MPNLTFNLPKLSTDKKPAFKQKELDLLLTMQLSERTPVLELMNPYLQALNRYNMSADKRLALVEKILPHAFASLQIIKQQYTSAGIPESFNQRTALNVALETTRQLIFTFKHSLEAEANALAVNRKGVALYSFRIMELLCLQQGLQALRYQKLSTVVWEELHQIFFVARQYGDIGETQTALTDIYTPKASQLESGYSIEHFYTLLQLFEFLDVQSWPDDYRFLAERYIAKDPPLEWSTISGHTNTTLTVYQGLNGGADKLHDNLPKEVLYLDLKPLIQRLHADQHALKSLEDSAPTPRRPVTVSRMMPSLALFLINKALARLLEPRKESRDFLIGNATAEVYSGWGECAQQLNPQASSEFERFVPNSSAIEDWKIIEDTPSHIRLRTRENSTTPPLVIGLLLCYKPSVPPHRIQLGRVERILKVTEREIEIGVQKLSSDSETVIVREANPDLKEKQWLVTAILTEENQQDFLLLERGVVLPSDKELLLHRSRDKVPITLRQRYQTWRHHEIYSVVLNLDASYDIASALAEPVLAAKEYVSIPSNIEEIRLTISQDADDEQEFTLNTTLTDHSEPVSQWAAGETVAEHYRVVALLSETTHHKRYHARHLDWDAEVIIERIHLDWYAPAWGQKISQLAVHPQVLSCYQHWQASGQGFVVSEYPKGQALHKYLKHHPLENSQQALDLAIQMAWALHYVNEQGVCHPALSPEVVWVELNQANHSLRCRLGQWMPNPVVNLDYAAPEQPQPCAEATGLSSAMNVYSWALMVWRLWLTRVAWQAQRPPTSALLQQESTRFLLPPTLGQLLMACWQNNPRQRPAWTEIVAELMALYASETGQDYARPVPEPSPLDSQNNQALACLDQGQPAAAKQYWLANLESDAEHLASAYNLALWQWRNATATDEEVLGILQQLQASTTHWLLDYLQGRIHLERGDFNRAVELFEVALALPQVKAALNYASDHQPLSRGIQQSHAAPSTILAMDLNPQGERVISGHPDGQVRLWQLHHWHLKQALPLHEAPVTAVSLSQDEQLALSADAHQVLLWSTHTGQVLHVFPQTGVMAVRFSPHQGYVGAGCRDKICRVWNTETRQLVFNLSEHRGAIHALSFSADNRYLVTASEDCTLKSWDISTGRCLQTFRGHSGAVLAVVLLPQVQQLISASADGSLRRWQWQNAACVQVYNGHQAAVTSVSVTPNGQFMLSCAQDATVRLWDLNTGRCLHTFPCQHPQTVIQLTENGEQALSAEPQHFQQWRIHVAEQEAVWLAPSLLAPIPPQEFFVSAVDQFERATRKAQASIEKRLYRKAFQLLQLARQQPFYEKDPEALGLWTELYGHLPRVYLQDSWQHSHFRLQAGWVKSACLSHKGQYLLAGSHTGSLQLWELITEQRRCLKTLEAHRGAINAIGLSRDDQYALTGGDDHLIRFWDLSKAEPLQVLSGHQAAVTCIQFLHHNQYGLSASKDHTLKLWDLRQGTCLHTYQGHLNQVNALAVSSDDRFFLSASGHWQEGYQDNSLKLWEVATGECLRSFEGHEAAVNAVCFAVDGQSAYSASDDGTIRQWHLYRGHCQRVIKLHSAEVLTLDLSIDGRCAVSSDNAHALYLWDIETAQVLQSFTGHHKPMQVTRLSADNRYLLSADRSDQATLWFLDWQLQIPTDNPWDWSTMPWLLAFFNRHTPYRNAPADTLEALQQQGEPEWSMQHFEQLCQQLGHAGYGWLEPKTIWQQLNTLAEHWQQPVNLFEPTETCAHCGATHQPPPVCLNCGEPIAKANPQAALQQVYEALNRRQYSTVLATAKALHEQSDYRFTPGSVRLWEDLYRHFYRSCFNEAWKGATLVLPQGTVTTVRLSQRSQYLLAGTDQGQLVVWELMTGDCRCIQTIDSGQGVLASVDISRDDQWVLSAGRDCSIKLWDLRQGQLIQSFLGHQDAVSQVLFLQHPGWILSASADTSIRLWSTTTGECLKILQGHHNRVNALAVSPDDRYVLSGAGDDLGYRDNSLKLWDLTTSDCLRTFTGHELPVRSVDLSPDGQFAYSGGRDGSIKQWAVYTGECVRTLSGHSDAITEIRLSEDGIYLLSGSRDNSTRLWEIASGDCIYQFTGHAHRVHSVELSNDLRYAVTAGDDRYLQLWHLDWDLELPEEAWDWGVMPWVIAFLNRQWMMAVEAGAESGAPHLPQWDSTAFKQFYGELGVAGYGWVEPRRLWQYLERLSAHWQTPRCILDMPVTCPQCDAPHQLPPFCLSCDQRLEVDAIQCPECGYERRATDTSPNWQCPRCGMDYAG